MSRQTILFSATFPEEVRRLADRYMLHPQTVRMHTGTRVTSKVDHAFYPVRADQKPDLLVELLRREKPAKFLVFTATREATSELASLLRRRRFDVISLSSLLSQANRERALQAFRDGECQALVATDVASRGLDITDIDLVVNYDVPMQADDYVHRIGRTGRAERTGRAITLVSETDERRARDIDRRLGEDVPRLELEGFPYRERRMPRSDSRARRSSGRGRRESGRSGRGAGGKRAGSSRGSRNRGRGRPKGE